MRLGLPVLVVIVVVLPALARSQVDTDTGAVLTISLHPAVGTTLHLPDEIVASRIEHYGEVRFARMGREIYLRPRPGTRAGVAGLLMVETATGRHTFRLHVVKRSRDAQRDVLVPPPEGSRLSVVVPDALLTPPVFTMVPPPLMPAEPAEIASATLPTREPAEPAEQEPATTADTRRDAAAPWSPCFALSVHALGALGTTAFQVAGYRATSARQSHGAGGVRVACHPHGTWWSVEASVTGEVPVTPTTHTQNDTSMRGPFELNGPRLRADVGLRGRFGATLMPTFHVGLGLQAYHLDIKSLENQMQVSSDLPFEGVMSLGVGLEYRAGNMLLGLDLHVRQGVSGDYRSVSGFVSVGFLLHQGE